MIAVQYPLQRCLVDGCQMVTFGEFCPSHRGEEAYECDACGELVHDDGKGEDTDHGIYVPGAGIVAHDSTWVCSSCLAQFEDAEIDRHEAMMDEARDERWYG